MPDSLHSTSLGVLMNKAGYTCAYAGKWHVHTNSLPDKQAFGFENLHGHNDFGLAEAAVSFLQRKKKGQPFFLVASFDNPHNICEYARKQNTPYATIKEPALEDCPGLPSNFAVNPYDATALAFEKNKTTVSIPLTTTRRTTGDVPERLLSTGRNRRCGNRENHCGARPPGLMEEYGYHLYQRSW